MLLFLSALAYGAVVVWLLAQETRLVFAAGSTLSASRPPFPYEHVDLPRSDGLAQFAWAMTAPDPESRAWVVYLHGNASTVASQVNISHYTVLRAAGLNVLAPEYRGFGGLPGTPTEKALQADAAAAYDYLRVTRRVPPESIVLYGWSLGAAVAVDLASRFPPPALMLEGAPASLLDLTARHYPLFPLRLFVRSSFDPIRRIGRIAAPVLVLHAAADEVIPIEEGRRLFAAARGAKAFLELEGSHVTAVQTSAPAVEAAVRTFLATHAPGMHLRGTGGM